MPLCVPREHGREEGQGLKLFKTKEVVGMEEGSIREDRD